MKESFKFKYIDSVRNEWSGWRAEACVDERVDREPGTFAVFRYVLFPLTSCQSNPASGFSPAFNNSGNGGKMDPLEHLSLTLH